MYPAPPVTKIIDFFHLFIVSESVADPLKYYQNNVLNTLQLLKACKKSKVSRFIFSSSASVYGMPEENPVNENTLIQPINPYGQSKAMSEQVLKDMVHASDLTCVSLRYFNVAGAAASKEA